MTPILRGGGIISRLYSIPSATQKINNFWAIFDPQISVIDNTSVIVYSKPFYTATDADLRWGRLPKPAN